MIYLYDNYGALCYMTRNVTLEEAKAFAKELSYDDNTVYTVVAL
jgi:hypothetical protein